VRLLERHWHVYILCRRSGFNVQLEKGGGDDGKREREREGGDHELVRGAVFVKFLALCIGKRLRRGVCKCTWNTGGGQGVGLYTWDRIVSRDMTWFGR